MDESQGSRKWVFVAAAAAAVAAIGGAVYYSTSGEKEEAGAAEEPATVKVAAAASSPAKAAPAAAAAPASQPVAPAAEAAEATKASPKASKPAKLTKRDLQFLRGMVHKREQNFDASFADVKAVSESFTSGEHVGVYTVDALYEYACYLELEGLLDDALTHIMHALQLDPEHVLSLVKLGYVQFSKAKVEEALSAFKKAQEIDETIGDIYLYRGMVHLLTGKVLDAIGDFKTCTEVAPDMAAGFYHLGIAYNASDQKIAARDKYEEGLKLFPEDGDMLGHLSDVYKEMGRDSKSKDMLEQALALQPDNPLHHVRKAKFCEDEKDAVVCLDKAVQADPNSPHSAVAHLELAQYKEHEGDIDGAMKHVEAALAFVRTEQELEPMMAVRAKVETAMKTRDALEGWTWEDMKNNYDPPPQTPYGAPAPAMHTGILKPRHPAAQALQLLCFAREWSQPVYTGTKVELTVTISTSGGAGKAAAAAAADSSEADSSEAAAEDEVSATVSDNATGVDAQGAAATALLEKMGIEFNVENMAMCKSPTSRSSADEAAFEEVVSSFDTLAEAEGMVEKAEAAKIEGNKSFKDKEYPEAAEKYNVAIELAKQACTVATHFKGTPVLLLLATYHNNKAQSLISGERHAEAKVECDRVMDLLLTCMKSSLYKQTRAESLKAKGGQTNGNAGQEGFCDLSTRLMKQALLLACPASGKPNVLDLAQKSLKRNGVSCEKVEDWESALESNTWCRMLWPNANPANPQTGQPAKDAMDVCLDRCIAPCTKTYYAKRCANATLPSKAFMVRQFESFRVLPHPDVTAEHTVESLTAEMDACGEA